jgi:hypothetical protein
MNRKTNRTLYGALLATLFLAVSFLTSCSSSSHTTTTPPPPPSTTPFAFYLSGQDDLSGDVDYYALAGAVTIDASGNVTGGEQDYNNAAGNTSTQPGGDSITGGALTVDATGQGTLTLITNNSTLGAAGTETLAVQFVNADHALISQFDGSATSSGSLDLQTLSGAAPSGAFAFTLSGVDPSYNPVSAGGVFTLPSASTDLADLNDSGTLTPAALLTVSLGTPDAFGRGILTSSLEYGSTGISFNYYVVGPEVIRIIDVDAADAAVGSAFGQGTNATAAANTSLAASVIAVSGDPFGDEYGVAGQITPDTTPTPATYSGVAEDVELDTEFTSGLASPVSGTYTIAANGYGSLTIGGFGGGDVHAMQVYAVDPTLDINDPNNVNGNPDVGGALLLEFEDGGVLAGGVGVAIPQTDNASADFSGNYAAGWQDFNDFTTCTDCEFDMVAQGSMASGGALSLTGEVSDPFQTLDVGATTETGATFNSTPAPDESNAGRFTMFGSNDLAAVIGSGSGGFDVIIYQASASQLFWLEYDDNSVFVGPIEVQGSLTGVPSVARPVKAQAKRK